MTIADGVDRTIGPADEEALRQCLRRYFPSADGRLARAATCTFTNTPDGHFILDRHPRWPQASAGSAAAGPAGAPLGNEVARHFRQQVVPFQRGGFPRRPCHLIPKGTKKELRS